MKKNYKKYSIAYRNNIECNPVIDNETTEFHGVKTLTCCALSPDYSEKIELIVAI